MAKFVPDINTKRWVVISPGRVSRPGDTIVKPQGFVDSQKSSCPFCGGNEGMTPPEVWRIGGEGQWNGPDWKVRVVPNKYEITDVHEVIIHSPNHQTDIENLPLNQVKTILWVYRQRYQAHEKDGQVLIFCNHGVHAGASLKHPHSQLVVLPRQINLDTLSREPPKNLVEENKFFTVYCPDFSQWPYEVWIAPKETASQPGIFKNTAFSQTTDEEIADLAVILKNTLKKLETISLGSRVAKLNPDRDFSYNYYIYHGQSWYLRIIPRFIHRAGFELGTGLNVNIVDPVNAAEELKDSAIS